MKKITAALGLAATLAASTLALAPTASAEETCPWPYVCFEDGNGHILTMYKDQGWQNTGSLTRSAAYVTNARHDDCALLKYSSGFTDRLYPGQGWSLGSQVVAIDILSGC
ncbi:hypothetical protein [Streptomyces sp. NRRL WC-3742]|uniref:hypothetical protein n=1 Tax=Streptomyces sp. NRRL WC-3742 TaxID=1463934 RepID=UPI00069244E2|nr:hypothetical protein [Streptomyces sp. NRRL WC-3742]